MQLQLSLTLADDLYDLLLLRGDPVEFMEVAPRLLALKGAPESLCRQTMDTFIRSDHRFCWSSPSTIGLRSWKIDDPDLSECAFVVVDLETTGTRAGPGKITEIGAVRIEGMRETAVFETLVNPRRPIHPKVIEITGITPQMVVNAPRIEQVMPHFLDFVRGAVIVAHNAAFDLSFLNYELTRLKGRRLGEGAIDTVLLARRAAPGLPNYRLGTVAECLGSNTQPCHRALADAQATAHVFLTLAGRLQEQGITRLGDLRAYVDPGHKGDRRKIALTDHLPRRPGAYLFLDGGGNVLYVGKAESLRDRVRSYFLSGASHSRKTRQALRRLERVEHEETATPLEALMREQELILQHRPPANVHGRRPENYVYLKVERSSAGTRLYVSDRRRSRQNRDTEVRVIGPFRGRSRAAAAIELLRRCYPIRHCTHPGRQHGCLYRDTERCLGPCRGAEHLERHEELVRDILAWLTVPGGSEDGSPSEHRSRSRLDPVRAGKKSMRRLSSERRFEEAQKIRDGLEAAKGIRRSYQALAEARRLSFAALWPFEDDAGPQVRVNLVWEGDLVESVTVTPATASLEIGRLLRTVPLSRSEKPCAVGQEELDRLLAVRRWHREEAGSVTMSMAPAGLDGEDLRTAWRRDLQERVAHCWEAL